METLEQLTLNGAMTLLSYLQYSGMEHQQIRAEAVAAALCAMLTQLESDFPGYAERYGWTKMDLGMSPTAPIKSARLQPSLEQDIAR
jgi:hypothetical protein